MESVWTVLVMRPASACASDFRSESLRLAGGILRTVISLRLRYVLGRSIARLASHCLHTLEVGVQCYLMHRFGICDQLGRRGCVTGDSADLADAKPQTSEEI